MELPDCGTNCSVQDCRQLDFLPVTCTRCGRDFCRLHFPPADHGCLPPNGEANTRSQHPLPALYECSVPGCPGKEQVPIQCSQCGSQVCLTHRHQADHACSAQKNAPPKKVPSAAAAAAIDQIRNGNTTSKSSGGARGAKSEGLAARVQLMKLKQRAKGLQELPAEERVYFQVEGSGQGQGIFVSRLWSVGKCIDVISSQCGVKNWNNEAGKPQLNLYDATGNECFTKDKGALLGQLIEQQVVTNGQTIQLRYVDQSCPPP